MIWRCAGTHESLENSIEQLDSKCPEFCSSFYVSVDVEDTKVFMDGHIWPGGIIVRW